MPGYRILTGLLYMALIMVFPPIFQAWGTTALAQEKVVLATLNWEPYIGEDLEDQGYLALIVKEAYKRGGFEVDIRFHQWSRVIGLAKRGEVDGYFPEYYSQSILSYARFSSPIPAGPLGFFKRTKTPIDYTRLEELKPYRIGIVKGYINAEEFDSADYLEKHPVKDDLTNFKLLIAGRVDLIVADKFVGHHLMKKYMPDKFSAVAFLPKILEKKEVFVCIGSQSKRKERLLHAFNTGLRQMKADKTLFRLLPKAVQDVKNLP